ncbi:hypothetical protein [Kineococcus glutinatus]|uniref:Uncharacterized protein n=1 Tax=Kineococcus glutinatus TaxID=1070872 RepID=A0ABP9HKS9_9ACTN
MDQSSTLPTTTEGTASCPSWCEHTDLCRMGAYQGPLQYVTASASLPPTAEHREVPVPVVAVMLLQDHSDPAPYVYVDAEQARMRVHEVRALRDSLDAMLALIEGGAR